MTIITQAPGVTPNVRTQPRREKKSGNRDREKKLYAGHKAAKVLFPIMSGLTESMDFISALYKALPWCVRPVGFVNPARMAETLLKEWQYIDWRQAMSNLVANQVEDAIIGRLSQELNKFSKLNRSQLGYHSGIGKHMENMSELLGLDTWNPSEFPADKASQVMADLMADYTPPTVPKERCAAKWRAIKSR